MLKYLLILLMWFTSPSFALSLSGPSLGNTKVIIPAPSAATSVYCAAVTSVVLIDMKDSKGHWAGKGSGFVINLGGHKFIATAGHCLSDKKLTYTVVIWDGTVLPVLKKSVSTDADIGLASVDEAGLNSCHALTLADKNAVIGTDIFALGYPYTFRDMCETTGVVSQYLNLNNVDYVAVTAVIWHGDSGGPILDSECNVVGVIAAMLHCDEQSLFYFAIPVEKLNERVGGLQAALR